MGLNAPALALEASQAESCAVETGGQREREERPAIAEDSPGQQIEGRDAEGRRHEDARDGP